MIAFRTLGGIDVRNAQGCELKHVLAQPKRVALLAVLALDSGARVCSRDALLEFFWPDTAPERARANLRQALRFLRRELDEDLFVSNGAGDIRINAAALACDAVEFEQACAAGRHTDALQLYQGEFFDGACLPDSSQDFEEWLERRRHQLRHLASLSAKVLATARRQVHDLERALHWTRFGITLAPDDEELQRTLYQLMNDSGNRSGALQAFNEFSEYLHRQLGVGPSSSTQAVVAGIRARGPREPTDSPAEQRSGVAVLTLVNLTGDGAYDVLCYGITDEIRSLLVNAAEIRVFPVVGEFAIKGRGPDLDKIRQRLSAASLLDGAVWKEGDKIRVGVHLIDLVSKEQVWAASHERELRHFDAARPGIAREIVDGVHTILTGHPRSLVERPTANIAAYNLYLKGRFFWSQRPRASEKTLLFLEQAVKLEPTFALAHAGIADLYNTLGAWEASEMAPLEAFPKARSAASRALELDPRLAEAYTAMGYANTHFHWDLELAERQFRQAIELKPHYGCAHHWLSHLLLARGRVDESLAASVKALECDPLDVVINVHLAWHYWLARQYEEVLEQCSRTAELDANEQWVPMFSGYAHIERGNATAAIDAHRLAVQRSNGSPVMLGAVGYSYAVGEERRLARSILTRLEERGAYRGMYGYEMAIIHGALQDHDSAFDYLDRACREHSSWLAYIDVDPRLDRLRADARFGALRATVRLNSAAARAPQECR